jgi:hypothetical protein
MVKKLKEEKNQIIVQNPPWLVRRWTIKPRAVIDLGSIWDCNNGGGSKCFSLRNALNEVFLFFKNYFWY